MIRFILILLIGSGLGALMGHFGKCNSGQCPLTSTPLRGAIWGAFLAFVFGYNSLVAALRKPLVKSENLVKFQTKADFDKIINKKDQIVLLDFYASWCGPCRKLSPIINQVADTFVGKIKVIKINIDDFSDISKKYNISSIPCVLVLNKGIEIERFTGFNNYEFYANIINKYIKIPPQIKNNKKYTKNDKKSVL